MRLFLRFARRAVVACTALPLACASSAHHLHDESAERSLGAPHFELRRLADRPLLGLIARRGDPVPAVAVAVAHDLGSEASVALSALVEARLADAGLEQVESRVHALGFVTYALIRSADDTARFVRAAGAALAKPVNERDPAFSVVRARTRAIRLRSFRGEAEAALAACSGELGVGGAASGPITASRVESYRERVFTTNAVAFAAVGSDETLRAAASAVEALPSWPTSAGPDDPWPEHDWVGVSATDGERGLSVALRLGDARAALRAARSVGAESSDLTERLVALEPAWSIERVTASTRPRGACLRLDLGAPRGDPGPEPRDVARASLVAFEELERAIGRGAPRDASNDDVELGAQDPREAAAVAAWRALSGRFEPGDARRIVNLAAKPQEVGPRASAMLEQELRAVTARWQKPELEHRERLETGQGELWVLLASPCGTHGESETSAGLRATVLEALARRASASQISIEPWVTPDGAGLLAHAKRRDPRESPQAQAERIATALARALLGSHLSSQDVALARSALLTELSNAAQPGYWLALDALAPNRPSLLEARGTWSALSEGATLDVDAERRLLAEGPLRVATLANVNDAQSKAVLATLERWLRPVRSDDARCPATRRPMSRTGELTVQKTPDAELTATAYVAAALPATGFVPSREARITELLLNRKGGWLEQALKVPGLASSAHARVLGGATAAGLIIEIAALEGRAREAVAQVRGLLERLGRGAATEQDLELGRRALERSELLGSLDPRRRIVDLWRSARPEPPPTLASLRAFHEQALRPENHVVVYVNQR